MFLYKCHTDIDDTKTDMRKATPETKLGKVGERRKIIAITDIEKICAVISVLKIVIFVECSLSVFLSNSAYVFSVPILFFVPLTFEVSSGMSIYQETHIWLIRLLD